jgi:hypothetical protein
MADGARCIRSAARAVRKKLRAEVVAPRPERRPSRPSVYDVVTRRRPHIATVLGVLFLIGVNVGMQLSGIGAALVERRMP